MNDDTTGLVWRGRTEDDDEPATAGEVAAVARIIREQCQTCKGGGYLGGSGEVIQRHLPPCPVGHELAVAELLDDLEDL